MKALYGLIVMLALVTAHAQNFVWGHSPVLPSTGIQIVHITTNYLATTGSSLTTTIPATAAGNCLAICSTEYHSFISSFVTNGVTATAGFQLTTNCFIGDATTRSWSEGWIMKNCGGNITTLNIGTSVNGSNSGYTTVVIIELSGLSTTAPYTAGECMAGQNGGYSGTSTQDTGGQVTNGTANSIYIAICQSNGANHIGTINATGTDGTWIEPPNTRGDGNVSEEMSVVYQIVSTSAARKHVWNRVNDGNGTIAMEFVLHP